MTARTNANAMTHRKPTMMERLRNRRQRGVTLVELSVAVAVMGLIMAGAMVGVPRLMNNVKLSQEMKDWQMSALAVQNSVATGVLAANATKAEILKTAIVEPFNRPQGGDTLLNRFGGAIDIKGVSGTDYPSSGVEVESKGYPSAQCTEFAAKMASLFATLDINGADIKSASTPLDVTKIADACVKQKGVGGGADTDATQATLKFTIAG